jgi:lysophospholipase L1-like esterase
MPARARVFRWFLPAIASLLFGGVLSAGFALALSARFGEPMAPLPAAKAALERSGAFKIVALGDSLTLGTGDAGGGYGARLAEVLRRDGRVVTFTNLAVNGAETADVLGVIAGPEASQQIAAADLLLVSAGGNDFNHGMRSVIDSNDNRAEVPVGRARQNLRKIVSELRRMNPKAAIRLLGLYNPYEVAAGESEKAKALLLDWNVAIEQATQPFDGVIVVPIADLFASRGDLLAGDRFHPGPRGHEVIADRMMETLAEVAGTREGKR